MEYKKRIYCAICKNKNLIDVVFLGKVPLAGNFPKQEEIPQVKKYDLFLQMCEKCSLVQTDSIIDSDILFRDYRYMSSIGLSEHFTNVAKLLKKKFQLNKSHKILEIGSNDGVLLKPLMDLSLNVIGIEPAINISKIAKEKGCNVINDYFNEKNAQKYFKNQKFDLVISNNCFAHIDDIHSIVKGTKDILKEDSYFIIEVHYLKNLIDELQYDFIYHEHLYYYSLNALHNLFKQFNMSIIDFNEIDIHSGSIRVYIQNTPNKMPKKVLDRLKLEKKEGMTKSKSFINFGQLIKEHKQGINKEIRTLKEKGYKVAAFGASGRGNMLLNMCGLTNNEIDYVVDESPERVNRYIAGVNIPIVKLSHLLKNPPDYIFILAWNYFDMIKDKLEVLGFKDLKYILPFPKPNSKIKQT